MTADLKPYQECKDSSVPWLWNAPSHWIMGTHTDFNKLMAEVEKDTDKNAVKLNSKRLPGEIVGSAQS